MISFLSLVIILFYSLLSTICHYHLFTVCHLPSHSYISRFTPLHSSLLSLTLTPATPDVRLKPLPSHNPPNINTKFPPPLFTLQPFFSHKIFLVREQVLYTVLKLQNLYGDDIMVSPRCLLLRLQLYPRWLHYLVYVNRIACSKQEGKHSSDMSMRLEKY